jgi:hypothetical protein
MEIGDSGDRRGPGLRWRVLDRAVLAAPMKSQRADIVQSRNDAIGQMHLGDCAMANARRAAFRDPNGAGARVLAGCCRQRSAAPSLCAAGPAAPQCSTGHSVANSAAAWLPSNGASAGSRVRTSSTFFASAKVSGHLSQIRPGRLQTRSDEK